MYRIRTVFENIPGTPWLSTMYFDESGGTAQQAATAVSTFWGAVDANMGVNVQWRTEPDVSLINEGTGELEGVENTTPGTGVGGAAAELLPIATQALVRWRTGSVFFGREVRGRTFIPGLTEAVNSPTGDPSAAFIAALQPIASALIADANSQLVVWCRQRAGSTGGTARAVATANVWNTWASLRSRRD